MVPSDTSPWTVPDVAARAAQLPDYVPPRLERLGSLAELTLGGTNDVDDGFGGAGDEGSV